MRIEEIIKNFISNRYDFLLKALFFGYLAFMIVFFIPIYEYSYQVFLYDFEKTTNYYGDIEYYVSMANGAYSDVIAPYKFRVLIPFLWSLFLPVLTFNQSYLIWNFLFLLGSSLLTDRYLNSLDFSNTMRIIGVVLLNISIPIITVGFVPTVDLGVLFFAILFMIGVVKNKWWLIGISSVLGVITKESIFFLFPLYFIYNHERIIDSVKKLFNEKVIPKKSLIND